MWIERKRERFRRLVRWSRLTMVYNIIIAVRCTAVVHIITTTESRQTRTHGRRTNGDCGGGVGETETARRDRDRAGEKYLVVPLMETVPI